MCRIDYAEGRAAVLHKRLQTARKEHRCSECRRAISPGENYTVERTVFEGSASTHKTCEHCMVARDWLWKECGGFIYGECAEDMMEHAAEGYGFRVAAIAVGMDRQWRRKNGALMPVPKMPSLSATGSLQ